jgi:hypothetical protein
MGLTNKREEQLRRMPLIESKVSRSKDGRYLIHRTTFTFVRPTAYYEAILANNVKVTEEEVKETDAGLLVLGEDLVKAH